MYPNNNYGQPPYGQPAYGQPQFGQGLGQPGMGQQGFIQPGSYHFTNQMVDTQAKITFMKYDMDRSGTLNLGELRLAANDFCLSSGSPPLSEQQFYALVGNFDVDRSGQLDFFEYKMLLEQLGGLHTYDAAYLQDFRRDRQQRNQQYMGFW